MVVGSIKKLKQETQTNVERQQEKRRSRLAEPIEGRRFHGLHETAEKPLTLKIISLANWIRSGFALSCCQSRLEHAAERLHVKTDRQGRRCNGGKDCGQFLKRKVLRNIELCVGTQCE